MSGSSIEAVELGELACWCVRHGDAELLVARQGAQVLSYRRGDAPPLIWLSEQAAFRRGQPVRGGIPVCWPWFGELARNPEPVRAMRRATAPAPAHGEVRHQDWQLIASHADDQASGLTFSFLAGPARTPDWPHQVELQLTIRLDQRLTLSLTSHNRDSHPVAFSQALHSYFAVGDIHQTRVSGLQGCRYIDSLADWAERTQQGPLQFTGETDRLYLGTPSQLAIEDGAWRRRLLIDSRGSSSAVVWNPWIDKARRLSQFAADAWQRMLCIETANVLEDHVKLEPGQRHLLEVSIGSQAL